MKRKIRMGMVGGGQGAFIGAVHRMAAAIDGNIELVCGAFSSDPEKSRRSGEDLGLAPDRVYGSFEDMIRREKRLRADRRMELVSIVTPNHMHFAPAKMALENGFHVICDKPMVFNLKEALALEKIVLKTGNLFGLTHTYTGYPMVKQAREMVASGVIGAVRKVVVEYPQGWLSTNLEADGQKQAAWRTDPKRSGIAGSMGDIGTHAANLAEYVTGSKITEMCADISIFVPGRLLDDDGNVLIRFENGAKGVLHASQISAGEENNINIRVWGEKGGLQWEQKDNNSLTVKWLDKPTQVYRTGGPGSGAHANAHTRTPAGHPEGYLEAFANLYRNFAQCILAKSEGRDPDPIYLDYPDIHDGVRGMRFIEKVIESGNSTKKWIKL
jgi:predicted dehydrogenase